MRRSPILHEAVTVAATEGGPVLFFGDLYGCDQKLERQLGQAPVR